MYVKYFKRQNLKNMSQNVIKKEKSPEKANKFNMLI